MRASLFAFALLVPEAALAQDHGAHAPTAPASSDHAGHQDQPGPAEAAAPADHGAHQDHAAREAGMGGRSDAPLQSNSSAGSGTALLPAAEGGMHGLHLTSGDWMVMAHGSAMLAYTDQSGPRGDDMVYTGSMAMLAAERRLGGGGRLQLHAMFSLDPLNGRRGYPNLFASGETANGRPLVDRQHPHDFFMELSARLDLPLAEGITGFVYGGPVAEPALGPSAFVHRRSARYLPQSPIGHHWFDSTHVTYGVATAGIATRGFQIEASAFRGREPDEHRWDIETPRLDSWSVRGTLTPSPNWTVQLSHGRLEEPEALHGGADERRTTASVHYARGGFSAMLGFAAKNRVPGETLTAWLGEANWDVTPRHSVFGRVEHLVNDELFPDHRDPLHDWRFRVTRFEGGYAYRVPLGRSAELALGASAAAYAKPRALDAAYGRDLLSYTLFARLALGQ
jgi:hypothetical protein